MRKGSYAARRQRGVGRMQDGFVEEGTEEGRMRVEKSGG